MKQLAKYAAAGAALLGGTGGVYAAGDHFGFRPAYIAEVREVRADMDQLASRLDWVRLENYESRLKRGQKLTRQECSDYRNIAKRLNITPMGC